MALLATPKQCQEIRRLWDIGHGQDEIAKRMKIHKGIVIRYLKEHHLKRTPEEARKAKHRAYIIEIEFMESDRSAKYARNR